MIAFMLFAMVPVQVKAESIPVSKAVTPVSAEAQVLLSRLDEIKSMDKSNLSSGEKKELRKEVRAIKGNLKTMGNDGVYISAGALIVIVLLLILLI